MNTIKSSKQSEIKIQSRGEKLEKKIENVIREMASRANKEGKTYVFNASQTAKEVPTTRRTLAKHDEFIRSILNDIKACRRVHNGDATIEQLREQINYLKELIQDRDKTIDGLRTHHIELYKRLYMHSLDAEILIRPILEKESQHAEKCLFCGKTTNKTNNLNRPSNVIHI